MIFITLTLALLISAKYLRMPETDKPDWVASFAASAFINILVSPALFLLI